MNKAIKICVVCNEPLFLDFYGENYICINGCQKIKKGSTTCGKVCSRIYNRCTERYRLRRKNKVKGVDRE